MGSLKAELERAGFRREEMEIYPAIVRFFQSGGDLQRLVGLCERAAKETLGEGQIIIADQGQYPHADAQPPMRNEGLLTTAENGQTRRADVPHPLPGEGHSNAARHGHGKLADSGLPNTSEGQVSHAYKANERLPSAGAPKPEGEANGLLPKGHELPASPSGPPIASGKASSRLPAKAVFDVPPAREPSAADIAGARYAADLTFGEIVKLRGRMLEHYRFKDLKNVRHLNNYENAIIHDCIEYGRTHRMREDAKIGLSIPQAEIQRIVKRAKTAIQTRALLTMPKSKRGRKSHG